MRLTNAIIFLVIAAACSLACADEPNVKIASEWWPELTNVVTPLAWRDHPHRFIVVFDGTLLALPQPQKLLRHKWDGGVPLEGVQLTFRPSADGVPPPAMTEQHPLTTPDGKRVGTQSWDANHAAPVLRTDWRPTDEKMSGLLLRQRVFAHRSGGGEATSGEEPMYAWVRLEVSDVAASRQADNAGFLVKINAPHVRFEMSESDNCRLMPAASAYPKPLKFEGAAVIEEGGN